MIGAEMFGRPIDYDTANDAVVRVKATEVRKKLAQYYFEAGKTPKVRIDLPSGSYVPRFLWDSSEAAIPQQAGVEQPASGAPTAQQPERAENHAADQPGRRSWRRLVWAGVGVPALVAVAAYIGFHAWWRSHEAHAAMRSIVVLPMENLSGDQSQDYLADGLTEELIADLGQISALRVISRTSAMSYKDTKKTVPEISRELGVSAVVEGSVLREGNEVRVTAQLIDAQTDQHLWARSYVRNMSSILALQGQVAQSIADEIKIEVTPEEQARLASVRNINPDAQDLYLQGMQRLNAGDPKEAIGYLEKAIAIDPTYAKAHAALANAYGWMGEAGWMAYSEAFPRQKAEAQRAIELDDALPEGHVELATAVMDLDWDWATQEKEFHRALDLNPNSAQVLWAYSICIERKGRISEALSAAQLALQLDPVSSRTFRNSAFAYYFARQYDQALMQMQRAEELSHQPLEVPFPLAVIYVEKGMFAEAIQQFQKLGDAPHALGHMGNAYARMGQKAKAEEMITKLERSVQETGIGRYEIAIIYAGLGDKDAAFSWLDKAYEVRDKGLTYLKIDPCVDSLRSDPRFAELVRRVGLPSS
jgi:TolB-like protein